SGLGLRGEENYTSESFQNPIFKLDGTLVVPYCFWSGVRNHGFKRHFQIIMGMPLCASVTRASQQIVQLEKCYDRQHYTPPRSKVAGDYFRRLQHYDRRAHPALSIRD